MSDGQAATRFAVCVANDGCDDLSMGMVHRVLRDPGAFI